SETVHAVAVDGQHRLVALREYRDKIRLKELTTREKATELAVIFILLAQEVGFTETPGISVRAIARELFTDLNKNAKAVDLARELILDDWSISARCLRTLITQETAKDDPTVLPLTLVRWQDPSNRFDQSYYLNSLVHLELLVDSALDLP